MKIYLFLEDKVLDFLLPSEVSGSFGFDYDNDRDSKLINVEARNGKWILYSTVDSVIISNNVPVDGVNLNNNSFYVLKRDNKDYLIYVVSLSLVNISLFSYTDNMNLVIGSSNDCTIQYNCPYLKNGIVKIYFSNGKVVLEKNFGGVYVNSYAVKENTYYINVGDQVNIYGLKFMLLNGMIVFNNYGDNLKILPNSNLNKYVFEPDGGDGNVEVKDIDLYSKDDFFSKSPRIRRIISTKRIKLDPPPNKGEDDGLPVLLTIGPMFTTGITSAVMFLDILIKINSGETTVRQSWASLVTAGVMFLSMLLWPIITSFYNKRLKARKRKDFVSKYTHYLEKKRAELSDEVKLQKDILIENLITVDACLNIIKSKNMYFWNKRLDQNDLLMVRFGVGNALLDLEISYPENGFSIDDDDLKKEADKLSTEFKYIENVPIGYSFSVNKLTAIMGVNQEKSVNFMNNILLQLLSFYSYEDLKLIVFTNEDNKGNWEYIKYLNHNFNNDRSFRFFASTVEMGNRINDYLVNDFNDRLLDYKKNKGEDKKNVYRPYYLIIIDDYQRVKDYELIKKLTECDDDIGFSMVIIEDKISKLPSRCNNYITVQNGKSGILMNSYDNQEQISFVDEVKYGIDYMEVARIISNVPIVFEERATVLPDAISFMEMEKVGKVEQLNILNRWKNNDSISSLKAEIGVNDKLELLFLDLHEKYHGPHGLIAGTTGSGKSEFIITYILSMCMNYSPDDVAFVLIDYKGGGLALAFENKLTGVVLPHLAGTITNLDKAEMDRTLVSIDSEVKRRQRLFNEARDKMGESTIDIYKYQRHFHEGSLQEPIPHLFIICDEFAELKAQQPEFMDNLISVARIGRSLGVHLILATQKPSGVVNDQIWSNTKFRVCLKVQDEADSKEMLKRPEAAHITQAGRFFLQVGYDEIFEEGQSGWCGAKYYPSNTVVKQIDRSINFINDSGSFVKSVRDEKDTIKLEAKGEQLAAIMSNIIDVSKKVNKKSRKLWLDNIPSVIIVDDLYKRYNLKSVPYNVEAIIGEYDAPEKQEQGIVKYNYLNDGNTIIYSQDGSESEMLLDSIIYSTSKYHKSDEVNFYIIDYGSESLRRYINLPNVGGMVFAGEDEKYNNLLKIIRNEIIERKRLFIDFGGQYVSYIKSCSKKIPLKVIIINNYTSFFDEHQDVYDVFLELVNDSERYGIIFIFTTSSFNSIQLRVSQFFSNHYAFKINDSADYMFIFNTRSKIVPRDILGRGLLFNDGLHEFQTASIVSNPDELNDYMKKYIDYICKTDGNVATRIPSLPEKVGFGYIKDSVSSLYDVPFGIEKHSLELCKTNLIGNVGTIISSNKLENMGIFFYSFTKVLLSISNSTVILLDGSKKINLDKNVYKNFYNSDFDNVLNKLISYFDSLVESNSSSTGVLLIYNINKIIMQLDDDGKLVELFNVMVKYEKFGIIVFEEKGKLKDYTFENWYSMLFSSSSGIWVGRGAGDQSILKTDQYNKEMQQDFGNNFGFYINNGDATLVKLIDFSEDK